jgi:hypothetical protein
MKNEVYGMEFFSNLLQKHPDTGLYIPKLYELTDTQLIREFIDSPPVGENAGNLDKLAKLLADIDRIEPYGEAKISPHFDYRDIRKNVSKWIEKPLASGWINQAQVDRADRIIDLYEPYLQPRIAHGDLSASAHAFVMPDSRIAFIDLEVFTPEGARYYDVARAYTRLYGEASSTDIPKKFLSMFLAYADEVEHREEQLMAIMVQRTIGMQRDAWIDEQKGRHYKGRAAELLELVLKSDPQLLLD